MYKKFILNNGIKVIAQKIPHVRSVSIGVWVNTGSIFETEENNGISHFIEHMLFKGTYKRTAKDIASSMDGIGGQLNAFTSKECTCYYSKVVDSHLNIAIEILSDMLFNSKFDENDIVKEKSVILEEINMYEDSPEDLAYDSLSKLIFNKHSLGLPILGTYDSIKSLNRNDLKKFMENNYNSDNIIIAVAGSFEEEKLIEELNEKFGQASLKKEIKNQIEKPVFHSSYIYRNKDIEQIHLCMGFEGFSNGEDSLYPLFIFNNIFGGSMSSRLFQTVREEHGLAYSIYTHPSFYKKFGLFTVYVSLNPSQLSNILPLITKETKELIHNYISEEELKRSKEQLKGNYILGLESTSSIMTMLGKSEIYGKKIRNSEEVIEKINNITMDDIKNIINKIFKKDKVSLSIVGNIDKDTTKNSFEYIKNSL
ncbi:M16 family metallopeptidase [Maledivibacter halophilus]|uniref:Predicted Zn-dependent peptidase n=1 Tax=Maledivibacter halophilus TaxID=36842 RepID=A0A1T5LDC4_9FIRM|nr:pitrilysin family protein [Maledivibacter halophilus]SKC74037.1 Predicted Zn-dependent peptidase [Maledivibacter halophilus]